MIPSSPNAIVSVEKEKIASLTFPNEDVLKSVPSVEQRRVSLEQAVVLGNTYKGKAKIIFDDSAGTKQIETHLWGLTDTRVILKQGIVIPVHRIREVKF